MSRDVRKAMIEPDHPELSLSRQCRLVAISRSSLYYKPRPVSEETLALMRRIDEIYLACPYLCVPEKILICFRIGPVVRTLPTTQGTQC
jgi:hypothetical protein